MRANPASRERWSDGATKRFLGAFVGGAVGLALPIPLGLATMGRCPVVVCSASATLITTIGSPVLAIVGAMLGHALMGGAMSPGAAIAGLLAGVASGLVVLLFHSLVFATSTAPAWPALVAASGLAIALQAVALESRTEALDEAPFIATPAGRFVGETLALMGFISVGSLLVALTALSVPPLALVLGIAALGTAPLIPYAVHEKMGGKGSVGAAYLGWLTTLVTVAAASALVAATGFFRGGSSPTDAGMFVGGVALAALVSTLGVPLFLEWSHGRALLEVSEEAPAPKLSLAPLPGPGGVPVGVVAGLSGTF